MVILAAFFAFFFLFADLGINVAWGVVALVALLALSCVFKHNKYLFKVSNRYLVMLIAAITVLVNMRSLAFFQSNPFYMFAMALTLVLATCLECDICSRRLVLKILFVGAFIVAAVPIISKLIPSFYINRIVPLLSPSSRSYVLRLMSEGYGGLVGAYISLTANYIVIGFAISVAWFIESKKKRNIIFALYFLLSLVFVNRRSELLACLAVAVVLLYLCLGKTGRFILVTTAVLSVSAVGVWLIGLKTSAWRYDGNNRLLLSAVKLVSGGDISNGRAPLYTIAWDLFCKNPIFGVGFGEFRRYGSSVNPNITNVHNIYLQLLCELGIVGAVVIFAALWCLLHGTYTAFMRARKVGDFAPKYFALFMTVYILVLGLFDNPIFQDTFWLLLCLIIFCSLSVKPSIKEKKYR